MSDIGDHLRTTARFVPKKVTSSDRLQMKWRVRNGSDEEIRVIGYSCPFYYENEFMGVFVDGQWVEKEKMISTNHVITVLRPGESRTYVWDLVDPQYYGITQLGNWFYKLKIHYEIFGKTGTYISEAEPAAVRFVSRQDREQERVFYRILSQDWQSIIDNLKGVPLMIPYLGTGKHLSCYSQRGVRTDSGPLDYIASCESITILAEVKLNPIDVTTIQKLIDKRKWILDVYRPTVAKESDVWGLIICPAASKEAVRVASQNRVQIVIASLVRGEHVLQPP